MIKVWWSIVSSPEASSSNGSQPAIIGLIVAICAGIGTLYSVWRQRRADIDARIAAAKAVQQEQTSMTVEASKQSFAQLIEALERSDADNERLRTRNRELENLLIERDKEIARLRRGDTNGR